MKTYSTLALLLTASVVAVAQASSPVVHDQIADSAANTRELPCLSMQEVKNSYAPWDLITSFARCVDEGDYDKAARLFVTARAYTRFDIDRVADKTVSDMGTIVALRMASYMSEAQRKKFDGFFHAIKDDPQAWSKFCTQIHRLGPPSYYPRYLVAHGMNAFIGDSSPDKAMKPNFDATSAWKDIETTSLHCKS